MIMNHDFRMTVVKRSILILGWGALGVLSPDSRWLPLSGRHRLVGTLRPVLEAVLAEVQPVVDRVAVALEEHHRKHGGYPRELSELVKRGFLSDLPELPSHWGTSSKYGPIYDSHAPLDFYD